VTEDLEAGEAQPDESSAQSDLYSGIGGEAGCEMNKKGKSQMLSLDRWKGRKLNEQKRQERNAERR